MATDTANFSEYVVYVDESGDHGLKNIDANYPVFVLAFCIFNKSEYVRSLVPAMQDFKFRHFGHDQIVLHETDIRKDRGLFAQLKSREIKSSFLGELTHLIDATPFTLVTTIIHKEKYQQRYGRREPRNPYHVALGYGLERVSYFLEGISALNARTHVIVEQRGRHEDDELELEFLRIVSGENYLQRQLPFELVFSSKKSNSSGLQLADLVARPVGLHVLRPDQPNRAFEVIKNKLYCNGHGKYHGWGLKVFP